MIKATCAVSLRRGMRACLGFAAMTVSPAWAAETPKERYTLDVACLAANEAAGDLPDGFAKERGDADTMRQLYAKRLEASGPSAGIAPEQAAAEVESSRKGSLKSIHAPDREKAKREQVDLADQVKRCAALPVFETLGKQAEDQRKD